MNKITFGRSNDCDIVFDEKIVSRHHGYLLETENKVYVVDENSKNGIYVNGRRITDRAVLSYGDEVMIAKKVPLEWEEYVSIDSDETILNGGETIQASRPAHTPQQRPTPQPQRALIDIPPKIEINQNHAEVYRNGDQGADWKVPFKRNMGNQIGNAVGKTVGCILSIVIAIAFFALIAFLLNS